MKTFFQKFFSSLPAGARLLLFLYALGFPLALLGHYSHAFDLYRLLALLPPAVCKGEVWRCLTYAFLPNGIVDWVVSLFWLATLFSVLGQNWTSVEMLSFCVLSTLAAAALVVALKPAMEFGVVGCPAMIFGLLAAWYRLYGRERLILLGVGELSVRQAAILVALIEVLIFWFCLGWFVTLAMLSGGAIGWLYLFIRGKTALNRRSQVLDSERIARLEL
jgi:membrane associated rhomboid family serine protease